MEKTEFSQKIEGTAPATLLEFAPKKDEDRIVGE